MTFYVAMQLGANVLKPLIKETNDKNLKRKYITALIVKSFLCLIFCIVFISIFSMIFGKENSIVGVVTVILLLTFRFSNLDFKVGQSAFVIMGIFIIFAVSPYLATMVNPILGMIINIISIIVILILSCHNTILSNQSTVVLSYILLYGYKIDSIDVYKTRVVALIFGGIIVSAIFYFKQRKIEFENTLLDVLKDIDINSERTKWQLKLALGISSGILIGELLHIPRTMWIGFSCMSTLHHNKENINFRFKNRPIYMILGCAIFAAIYAITPKAFKGYVSLIGGIMVGFSATYQWQTVFNCFGALSTAIPIFGLQWAIIIRIFDNVFGAIYSKLFDKFFDKIFSKYENAVTNKQLNEVS